MAKTQSLHSDDLVVSAPQNKSATRQRGVVPSTELIPMQFRMPPEFVQAFKQEALNRKMKLNEFMKTCFDVFMKNPQQ